MLAEFAINNADSLSDTRRLHRWRVAGALRSADVGHGGDSAGAARGGAGGTEGKTRRGQRRHCV